MSAADGRGQTADGAEDAGGFDDIGTDGHLVREAGRISRYEDLRVWQASIRLAETVYHVTAGLPDTERFGLSAQMRRAAVSVASNIAEGYGRGSTADYLRFLRMARGSLYELETQGVIAARVHRVPEPDDRHLRADIERVRALLLALMRAIERAT